jgi:hypothetical protein
VLQIGDATYRYLVVSHKPQKLPALMARNFNLFQHQSHRATPPLLIPARFITIRCYGTVVLDADADTRHKSFPCLLSLILDVLPHNLVAPPKDKGHECNADKQGQAQQYDVDRYWVILENLVGRSVKSRLGEVENAG